MALNRNILYLSALLTCIALCQAQFVCHHPESLSIYDRCTVCSGSTAEFTFCDPDNYPEDASFLYNITLNLLPKPVTEFVVSSTTLDFVHSFADVPIGTYKLTSSAQRIRSDDIVYFEPRDVIVKDSLTDLIAITVQQNKMYDFNESFSIVDSNKPVNFEAIMPSSSWVATIWTITRFDLNSSVITNYYTSSSFNHTFHQPGTYNITLEVSILSHDESTELIAGIVSQQIIVFEPLKMRLYYHSNVSTQHRKLLTVHCSGQESKELCYFTDEASWGWEKWSECKEIFKLKSCPFNLTVHFDENVGNLDYQFLNIGLRNAGRTIWFSNYFFD